MEKGYWVTAPNGVMFLMVVGAYSKILYDNRIEVIDYYSDLNGYHEKLGLPLEEYLIDAKIPRPEPSSVSTSPSPFDYLTQKPPSQNQTTETPLPPLPPLETPPPFNSSLPPDRYGDNEEISDVDKSTLGNIVLDNDFMITKPKLADLIAKRMRQMKRAIMKRMTFNLKILIQN
ncbi:uncharacterized protein LOC143919028 [Arctopsyche grandis]|uniref:uncharacterized protein LOC143919028 n=1 Tax=Arctopsyche grandis TaxID=121162 RepID=UPI00406D9709